MTVWPLLNRDRLEVTIFQGADIDMPLRMDLADIRLGQHDILHRRAGDDDLMALFMMLLRPLLLMLLARGQATHRQRQHAGQDGGRLHGGVCSPMALHGDIHLFDSTARSAGRGIDYVKSQHLDIFGIFRHVTADCSGATLSAGTPPFIRSEETSLPVCLANHSS